MTAASVLVWTGLVLAFCDRLHAVDAARADAWALSP